MTKTDFINSLKEKLYKIEAKDVDVTISYYSEMIDDYVDSGYSEEEAINKMGSIEQIISEYETSNQDVDKASNETKLYRNILLTNKVLIVLILLLLSPIIIAAFGVFISLVACFFAVLLSTWVVDISLAISSVYSLIMALFSISNNALSVIFYLGCMLVMGSVSILLIKPLICFTKMSMRYIVKFIMFLVIKIKNFIGIRR